MSSDAAFVDKAAEIPETNINAEREDAMAEKSEATGEIPKRKFLLHVINLYWLVTEEVDGLKDTIGGGQILDGSEGYTRSSNRDVKPMQQEQAVDAAVDSLE